MARRIIMPLCDPRSPPSSRCLQGPSAPVPRGFPLKKDAPLPSPKGELGVVCPPSAPVAPRRAAGQVVSCCHHLQVASLHIKVRIDICAVEGVEVLVDIGHGDLVIQRGEHLVGVAHLLQLQRADGHDLLDERLTEGHVPVHEEILHDKEGDPVDHEVQLGARAHVLVHLDAIDEDEVYEHGPDENAPKIPAQRHKSPLSHRPGLFGLEAHAGLEAEAAVGAPLELLVER
mmetsp:Transcript_41153/g.131714  ORF Transcript_41153/g.131714 Transcript_41153/m.131714 type:complete len:230 (-) Transcript_41153:627-1316(-)